MALRRAWRGTGTTKTGAEYSTKNNQVRPSRRVFIDLRDGRAKCHCRPLYSRDSTIASSPGVSGARSEEHTSELQSLMRTSYAVFCLKKKKKKLKTTIKHSRTVQLK